MTATRSTKHLTGHLRERADIPDEDIPELIALAEDLQASEEPAWGDVSTAELKDAARELDIDPIYIDRAVEELASRRALEEAEARSRVRRLRSWTRSALVGALVLCLGLGALGAFGAGAIESTATQVNAAEARVELVLERQAQLAPQLLALGGGDPGSLEGALGVLRAAQGVEAKLAASAQLSVAMAEQLAEARGDVTIKKDLSYELTGTQNRISTETRRLREAETAHREAASGLTGGLAVRLGLASAP